MRVELESPDRPAVGRTPGVFFRRTVFGRIGITVLGIVLGQAVLYGHSLIGVRIMLPLRLLAVPGSYLPAIEPYQDLVPHNVTLGDLVFFIEPERQFVNSELRAGRLPMWTPYRFAGAPLQTLGFSPPWLLAYLVSSPVVLAWTQMLVALIAGLGMYVFCRSAMGLGFWPAAIAAWCYPLTGAYVLWVGQWLPAVMCWLPWMLAAVDRTVRTPRGWGGPALVALTVFVLIGGALDIAGQVLLVSGIYAVWRVLDEYGWASLSRRGLRCLAKLSLAWMLGIICSAWLLIPLGVYISEGSRMARRSAGAEERPPVGFASLPQVVLPDMYGSSERGSFRIGALVLQESSAAAYAGSAACLVLAPLAWFSGRRRSATAALVVLVFISLGWAVNIPGMVHLLRLPVLNMMSHNRLVFVAGFALTALAAIGLDVLLRKEAVRRRWLGIPALVLLGLFGWCVYRAFVLPEPIASQLGTMVENTPIHHIRDQSDVAEIQQTFRMAYAVNAAFCGMGVAAWGLLWLGLSNGGRFVPALAALWLIELIGFAYGFASQSDPSLYFPKIPILESIAAGPPGRIIGYDCLPANLAQSVRLRDVRGYDGVDPSRIVQLLLSTRQPPSVEIPYAVTQALSPAVFRDPATGSPRVSPVLDMLNVRYVIFRGQPPLDVQPLYADHDYWVFDNERAMPRAFVPSQIVVTPDPQSQVNAMASIDFDPSQTAYVEQWVEVPANSAGLVDVIEDEPNRVTLSARMETEGLVVLADRWDPGWQAYVNDAPVPILRVNHALRGVVVGPGETTIRFVYAPAHFYSAFGISSAGGIAYLFWAGALLFRKTPRRVASVSRTARRTGIRSIAS